MQSAGIAARVQSFVESRSFPAQWADDEYSAYFDRMFTDKQRQRDYLLRMLAEEKVSLAIGPRVLAALMHWQRTRVVFTTNFDSVVEKAMAEVAGASLSAYHIEGSANAITALDDEQYPLYCKLHGDFRYDSIKNLTTDLATQNDALSQAMIKASSRFGFIVAGYSGRDASVMKLFHDALAVPNAFPHGLYWTGLKNSPFAPVVHSLIDAAKAKGVRAELVEIETFDALLLRMWRNMDDKPAELDAKVRRTAATTASIPLPPAGKEKPVLRLNAWPILQSPQTCSRLTLAKDLSWEELRALQRKSEGGIIATKGDGIYTWGTTGEIEAAFGDALKSIEDVALPDDLGSGGALHFKAFFEEALITALARERPLLARKRRTDSWLILDRNADEIGSLAKLKQLTGKPTGKIAGMFAPATEDLPQEQVFWAEALRVGVELRDKRLWLTLDPDVWIWPVRARAMADEFLDKRRGDRYNEKFNALIDAWEAIVFDRTDDVASLTFAAFDSGSGTENPTFEIGVHSAFARRLGR